MNAISQSVQVGVHEEFGDTAVGKLLAFLEMLGFNYIPFVRKLIIKQTNKKDLKLSPKWTAGFLHNNKMK